MSLLSEIEEFVVRFEGRGPGTDAERRAAGYLAARLRSLGRDAQSESIWVRPNYARAHLATAVLAILGSVIATRNAPVGLALAAFATLSALGDLSGRLYLLRRLTGKRASQTVLSPEDGGKPGTLILVAHYDAARAGAVFDHSGRPRATLARLVRRRVGPFDLYVVALLLLVATLGLRVAAVTGTGTSALQFAATVVLIACFPVFADIAVASYTPGAGDNASGVTTALRLAARYGGALEHFDLWVLLPGASEGLLLGMRAWIRRNRRSLDRRTTVFLGIEDVGRGAVRYTRREGPLLTRRSHSRLVALCEQIAAEDAHEGRYGALPITSREPSDAYAAAAAGFPAISVSCREGRGFSPEHHRPTDTPERLDEGALRRAFEFCSELVELIDERIGPDLEPASQPARPEPAEPSPPLVD